MVVITDDTMQLQDVLDMYAKDMKALVNIKPKQLDIVTMATMVRSIPERKWNAASAIANGMVLEKDLKGHVKAIRAKKRLEASAKKSELGLTSDADRAAWVDSDQEVQSAEIELIDAQATLTAAKLAYECLDDLFTSGKKIMDYLVDQEIATRQYNKFNNEGSRNGSL